jgi:two-component system response regulator AlgR
VDRVERALRVFIVDDEPPARNRLRELLGDCGAQLPLEVAGEAGNGREALDRLMETPVDLVLMDIRMPQMDGIELARHLQQMSPPVPSKAEGQAANLPKWPPVIIFTTAYDTYAIKAFELHAIDYLLKPIRRERLLEALVRAREAVPVQNEVLRDVLHEPRKHLAIHERGKIRLVPVDQVLYLHAELKYVTVRTAGHEYLVEEPLSALEREFSARFVRIHRNCLVAKDAIEGFEKRAAGAGGEAHHAQKGSDDAVESAGWMVKLKGLDELLAISRRQQHIVKEFG